jgi:hypothetical protein
MGPRAGLDDVKRRQKSLAPAGIRTPTVLLVARVYTDRALLCFYYILAYIFVGPGTCLSLYILIIREIDIRLNNRLHDISN